MNSSDVMETFRSISSTPQAQTPHRDESSPNVNKQTNKGSGSGNSLGRSYCCFLYIAIKIPNLHSLLITIHIETPKCCLWLQCFIGDCITPDSNF